MKQQLETITRETCIHLIEVKALIKRGQTYLSVQQTRCNNCIGLYYVQCDRYKPAMASQTPLRRGFNAIYFFWYKNVSIRGIVKKSGLDVQC